MAELDELKRLNQAQEKKKEVAGREKGDGRPGVGARHQALHVSLHQSPTKLRWGI